MAQGQESEVPAPSEAEIERWTPVMYQELRRIARRERFGLSGGETLATTALINEAYLHLAKAPDFVSRAHFLGTAAVTMRRILVDRVRSQRALKRGAGVEAKPLEEVEDFVVEDDESVLAVHEALESLAKLSPRLARIVECRFFGGYDEALTAEALGLSERTVQRDWATARAWLKRELSR